MPKPRSAGNTTRFLTNPLIRSIMAAFILDHNGRRPAEYNTWSSMIQRCTNPKHKHFCRYGARGICVCERWRKSYALFLADMGKKPSPRHSIDRIDPNVGYTPANCRWATFKAQQNNRTNNRIVVFNGERLTCTELAERVHVPQRTMFNWLNGADTNDMTALIDQKLAKRLAKASPRS